MEENHRHLVTLGVSHPSLETIKATTATPFGLSTKLTGAGGGGCAVTLIPDGKRRSLCCIFYHEADAQFGRLWRWTATGSNQCVDPRKLPALSHICGWEWSWNLVAICWASKSWISSSSSTWRAWTSDSTWYSDTKRNASTWDRGWVYEGDERSWPFTCFFCVQHGGGTPRMGIWIRTLVVRLKCTNTSFGPHPPLFHFFWSSLPIFPCGMWNPGFSWDLNN